MSDDFIPSGFILLIFWSKFKSQILFFIKNQPANSAVRQYLAGYRSLKL
jgi:hypothetical protein